MGALNSFALWGTLGLLGIAVPIIIHLLYRKHRRQTDWAAMELLRRALVIRSGQVKLEDYLILALRCLALLLLALALLRPTMNTGSSAWLLEKKVGMVVAIDASFSMNHGDHSRYERAVEKAREIVNTAKPGDAMSVVLMSSRPEVLLRGASYVPGQVADLLDQQKTPTSYRLSLERNIELLDELVDELKTPGKECFLITDSQELDWANLSETALAALERLTSDANVFVVPVGIEGEENLSVERLSYTSGSLRQSGEARFSAQVRNEGRRATDGGTLEFYVDGGLTKRITVGSLEPGEARALEFVTLFDNPGDVRIKAQLSADSLLDDNVRHAVARIRSGISVLSVEGGPSGGAGETRSGSYYAKVALRPKDSDAEGGILVSEIEAPDLALEQLGDYDIILLSNVLSLSSEMVQRLKNFVARGGGMIVFAGDLVDASEYNKHLGGEEGILPAVLSEVASCEDVQGWTIAPPKSDHLLAGVVSRYPEKLLNAIRVKKLMLVEPTEGAETILSLETGAPLLLSRDIGTGSVLFFTTSGNKLWNNLPREPLYTILLQQAVTNLTSDPDSLQLTVGNDVDLAVTGREIGDFVSLLNPSGGKSDIRVTQDQDQTVAAVEIEDLGVYEITAEGDSPAVVVAANIDATESNVRVIDGSVLASQLDGVGVKVLNPERSVKDTIEKSRRGHELAHLLLWLAIIIFVLQSVLARHFTNKMDRDDAPGLSATLQMSQVAAARRS
ncbi:MAG: BatA domain-containing protein [Roseibacillus sp.]